ncbi:hypothetical protein BC828DRAFT_395686 [Blastocladiella britannica]|nr:hypothetical protein BC828DRAFT_395686 [Blastocladiella britannica]
MPLLPTIALQLDISFAPAQAAAAGRTDLLERRRQCGLPIHRDLCVSTQYAVEAATAAGHTQVLEYLRRHRVGMLVDVTACLVLGSTASVLDWWVKFLAEEWSDQDRCDVVVKSVIPAARTALVRAENLEAFQWWVATGDRVGAPLTGLSGGGFLGILARRGFSSIVQWCISESGPATCADLFSPDHDGEEERIVSWWVDVLSCLPMDNVRRIYSPTAHANARAGHYQAFSQLSQRGRADLLQFWCDVHSISRQQAVSLMRSLGMLSLEIAARHAHIGVLEWWSSTATAGGIRNDELALGVKRSLLGGNPASLAWFTAVKKMDLTETLTDPAILAMLCSRGHLEMLQWCNTVVPDFVSYFTANAVDAASRAGQLAVLDWVAELCRGRRPVPCSAVALTDLQRQAVPTLDWWAQRHASEPDLVPFVSSPDAIDRASAAGSIAVLDWFIFVGLPEYGITPVYSAASMDEPSRNAELQVLNWWLHQSGMPVRYSADILDEVTSEGLWETVDWWIASELPLTISWATLKVWKELFRLEPARETAVDRWQKSVGIKVTIL